MHRLDAERALLGQLRSALDGGSRRFNGKRMKADEIAQLAAATALKLGDLKTYCEVQADPGGDGRWAAALAMAPAVGNQHSFTMARSALLLTSFIITLDSMIYRITNFSLAGRQNSSLLPTTCDQLS